MNKLYIGCKFASVTSAWYELVHNHKTHYRYVKTPNVNYEFLFTPLPLTNPSIPHIIYRQYEGFVLDLRFWIIHFNLKVTEN